MNTSVGCLFLCLFAASIGRGQSTSAGPSTGNLQRVLATLGATPKSHPLPPRVLDSLLMLMRRWDAQGTADSGSVSMIAPDTLTTAMERVIIEAGRNSTCIKLVMDLHAAVQHHADVASLMSGYVQECLRTNTAEFLRAYLTLSEDEREEVIDALDEPAEFSIHDCLKKFARSTKSPSLRRSALSLAKALSQDEQPQDAP